MSKHSRRAVQITFVCALFVITIFVFASADGKQPTTPPTAQATLGAVDLLLQHEVDQGRLAGAVALVAQNGNVPHIVIVRSKSLPLFENTSRPRPSFASLP